MDSDTPTELAAFLARFDAFVASGAVRAGPLSNRLFGASDRVDEIRAGKDVGVRTLHRASEALAALEADAATGAACERPARRTAIVGAS